MKFVDTHSHLFSTEFNGDRAAVRERAMQAGVTREILAAVDSSSHDRLFEVADSYPDALFAAMGLHPTSVNDNPNWKRELEIVKEHLASSRKFYAIGEAGLDLYWSKDFLKEQQIALRTQIELALEYDLPLILHTRDAWEQMIELLSEYKGSGMRAVMHGYSASELEYEKLEPIGDIYVGIGGVVTFKNSSLAATVRQIPLSRIVLETDAPYLTPHPYRGSRNEAQYIPLIAQQIAQIKGISVEQVAQITTTNAETLFCLPK